MRGQGEQKNRELSARTGKNCELWIHPLHHTPFAIFIVIQRNDIFLLKCLFWFSIAEVWASELYTFSCCFCYTAQKKQNKKEKKVVSGLIITNYAFGDGRSRNEISVMDISGNLPHFLTRKMKKLPPTISQPFTNQHDWQQRLSSQGKSFQSEQSWKQITTPCAYKRWNEPITDLQ